MSADDDDKDDRSIEDREQAMQDEAGQMEQRLDKLGDDIDDAESKAKDIREPGFDDADADADTEDSG